MNVRPNLKQQALDYVLSYPGTLRHLADECGVDYEWIRKFKNNRIPDPGVRRIQAILDHRDKKAAA